MGHASGHTRGFAARISHIECLMEPIIRPRRVHNMKRSAITSSILFLATVLFAAVFAACGSDSTNVTSGDLPDDVPADLPIDPDYDPDEPEEPLDDPDVEPALPIGPLGAGGPLVTADITITHPDADDVVYSIACLGDTATVIGDVGISEFSACSQLGEDAVRTRLLDGAPSDQVCTEIYGGPDVATIVGTYDGVDGPAIDTTIDRTNGCGIDEWDRLLSDVLPNALGVQ